MKLTVVLPKELPTEASLTKLRKVVGSDAFSYLVMLGAKKAKTVNGVSPNNMATALGMPQTKVAKLKTMLIKHKYLAITDATTDVKDEAGKVVGKEVTGKVWTVTW